MPTGRPTIYSQELADSICEWLADGKSLRSYCKQDGTPGISTITRWIVSNKRFWAQYAQAREAAGYAHADNIVDIVQKIADAELEPNAARVMMDGLKWSAERMAPKSHMPQSLVNHESPNGTMTPKPTEIILRPADEEVNND